jgi:hypothetical protein
MVAINYILETAMSLKKPVTFCLALGSSQGAHNGRTYLERYLQLREIVYGLGIVIGVGNEGNARRHYYGMVDRTTGLNTMELQVGDGEEGFSMEFWGQAPYIYYMDILSPFGEYIPKITTSINLTGKLFLLLKRRK